MSYYEERDAKLLQSLFQSLVDRYIEITDWSLGYFAVLPIELLQIILRYLTPYICPYFLVCHRLSSLLELQYEYTLLHVLRSCHLRPYIMKKVRKYSTMSQCKERMSVRTWTKSFVTKRRCKKLFFYRKTDYTTTFDVVAIKRAGLWKHVKENPSEDYSRKCVEYTIQRIDGSFQTNYDRSLGAMHNAYADIFSGNLLLIRRFMKNLQQYNRALYYTIVDRLEFSGKLECATLNKLTIALFKSKGCRTEVLALIKSEFDRH